MNLINELIKDEISFLDYLIEYPELCIEKCKERRDKLKRDGYREESK